MWKRNQRLFEEQGDNGGTGGGGAAALTAEDVARIANQAVTAQLKRELPKAFEGFLPSFTKAIDDKLASFKPTEQPADEKNKGASPELSALQRQTAVTKLTIFKLRLNRPPALYQSRKMLFI